MYLKKLSLYENSPEEKLIRSVEFKKGLNLIVDESDKSGNNVGKTTFLKLIDICLGAQDRKYIYVDFDTKGENTELKNYIYDKKVSAILIIGDSLDEENGKELKVELFEKGKRYVDGEKLSYKKYCEEVKEYLFNCHAQKPTLRQLIPKFIRISQKGDTNSFLKYLVSTSDVEYQSIYSYLFNLRAVEVSQKILELQKKIKECEDTLSQYRKIHKFKNISELSQKIDVMIHYISDLNQKLNVLFDTDKFKFNENEISRVRVEYNQKLDQIDELKFKKLKVEDILNSITNDNRELNKSVMKSLYSEVEGFYPQLNKSFNQLVKFNNELLENKKDFYLIKLNNINLEIQEVQNEIEDIFQKYKDIMLLVKENNFVKYTELNRQLLEYQERKGRYLEVKDVYTSLEKELVDTEDKLGKIESGDEDLINQKMSLFNTYFTSYSQKICKQNYYLYYSKEGFPIHVGNVDDGLGTGSRKSIISAFDLAYAKYCQNQQMLFPKFIVHDVLETMDGESFEQLVNIIKSMDSQYIVAVLNEKIAGYEVIGDEDKVLSLSKIDKLFKL